MSTPTTAAAPLPHYGHHSHHHFPYTPHPGYPTNGASTYRNPASAVIPPISSFGSNLPSLSGYAISASGSSRTHPSTATRVEPIEAIRPAEMPPPVSTPQNPQPAPQRSDAAPPTKRRRSDGPNWGEFYKNGLPKEVIVIEDTPEAEQEVAATVTVKPFTGAANPATNGTCSSPATGSAKKRKREEERTAYDPVYGTTRPRVPQQETPQHPSSTNSSTISTDGTAYRLYNASTSISSSGTYDDPQSGQKRKRTRRNTAESKRDAESPDSALFAAYIPPSLPPKKAAEVNVKVVREPRHSKHTKVDDDDGHYIVVPETDLTDNYKIIKVLGQGTFGKVVQATDRRRNKLVAIKIIRSVQKYRDASKIELRVLQTLKLNDEENRNRCIHLRDCFDFRGHICIVMDLLGQSVFDFLKGTAFVPFPNSQIQSFARQLFTSVAYLHDVNLIHTDLKPENILLVDDSYQTFTYNRKIPSSSHSVARQAQQRRVLLNPEIRLIDFGSATFEDEYHSSVVSTRHYRAPEIILGLGWSYPCDIWSIGCILVEFFTGDALFQTHDNLEHLAMMEAVVGSKIDNHLVQAVGRVTSRSNTSSAVKYFKRGMLDYPNRETTRVSKRFVKNMKNLTEIIPTSTPFMKNFLDLLKKIFVYDPSKRITAKQALQHPWLRETPPPDDGTEASKIRRDRARQERLQLQETELIR